MAISLIGSSTANASTVTLPGAYLSGDLLVIWAVGYTTGPSLPAGWTSLLNQALFTGGIRAGWRLATSSSDTSGTWTSANFTGCSIYRGVSTSQTPIRFINNFEANTTTTITYVNALQLGDVGSSSWIFTAQGSGATDSAITTAPGGMTNQSSSNPGTSGALALFDSNGTAKPPVTLGSVSIGGTANQVFGSVCEIKADTITLNNYQQLKVGDGMSCGEKIR